MLVKLKQQKLKNLLTLNNMEKIKTIYDYITIAIIFIVIVVAEAPTNILTWVLIGLLFWLFLGIIIKSQDNDTLHKRSQNNRLKK